MDPDSYLLLRILILLALIGLNAFFVLGETAMVALSEAKLKKMAEQGDRKAAQIARMLGHPTRFSAAIRLGMVFSGAMLGAVGAQTFAPKLSQALYPLPGAGPLSFVLTVGVLAMVCMIAGGVCKRLAGRESERFAASAAGLLAFFLALGRPFVAISSLCTGGLLRLARIDPNANDEAVTAEEIRMLLDEGNESGGIEEGDREMINNIFDFHEMTAEELMIHRTDVLALDKTATLQQVVEVAVEENYTRIPVYDGDLDKIVGILNVKDLLELVSTGPPVSFDIATYLREPFYATESMSCKALFSALRERRQQIAVVVDEYGGTAGIITMEDLVEGIVGNIQDEYDDEEDEIAKVGEGEYLIDGVAGLEDVCETLGFAVEEDDLEEFETIGGYIVQKLGHIPEEGEQPTVNIDEILFTVLSVEDHRIVKLKAQFQTIDN